MSDIPDMPPTRQPRQDDGPPPPELFIAITLLVLLIGWLF